MKFAIGTLLTALAAANYNDVDFEFMKWVSKHAKNYTTVQEFETRMANWIETDDFIKMVNHHDSEETHTAGHNKFSDWTEEEFAALMTEKEPINHANRPELIRTSDSPIVKYGTVDWRDSGCVNPVQDQGSCGSCWAFAATASVESSYCIGGGALYKLSEEQLVNCDTDGNDGGCDGGLAFYAWDYLQTHGQMLGSEYPYTATDNNVCKYDSNQGLVMTVPGSTDA